MGEVATDKLPVLTPEEIAAKQVTGRLMGWGVWLGRAHCKVDQVPGSPRFITAFERYTGGSMSAGKGMGGMGTVHDVVKKGGWVDVWEH